MSTSIVKLIEVKDKSGKWVSFPFYTPLLDNEEKGNKVVSLDDGTKLVESLEDWNGNALRDQINWWYGDRTIKGRGLPDDVSDEVRLELEGEYHYGQTWATVSELVESLDKDLDLLWDRLEKLIPRTAKAMDNRKLDYLIALHRNSNLSDFETWKRENPVEINADDEGYVETLEDLNDEFVEYREELTNIIWAYDEVYRLYWVVCQAYPHINEDDVRIVMYYC